MKAVALIPFGYSLITRFNTARDFLYLVVTQWIPGIWLLHRLGGVDLAAAAGFFAAGYLAFIALYEIGYFVNDTWDARRQPDARHRFSQAIGPGYAAAFVVIRLAVWAGVSLAFERLGDPDWLALCAALGAAFALHNALTRNHLRLASFIQLTLLRFAMPVLFTVDGREVLVVLVACLFFYLNFRSLAYLDSKGFLIMPERKGEVFGFLQIILITPLVIVVSLLTAEPVLLQLLVYFAMLYGLYALSARRSATA